MFSHGGSERLRSLWWVHVGVPQLYFCCLRCSSRPALVLWVKIFNRNEPSKRGPFCEMLDEL